MIAVVSRNRRIFSCIQHHDFQSLALGKWRGGKMMGRNAASRMIGAMVLFLIFWFSVPAAFGQGNISLGRLEIHPGAKYEIVSDSNIYVRYTDEQDDIIHRITPSLALKYAGTTPGNYFSIGYLVDFVVYSDFDLNNYENHNPSAEFGLESPAGLFLKVKESYASTEDPYGAENTYGIGRQTARWNNTVDATIGYEYGAYRIDAGYKNYVDGYDLVTDKWQERQDHEYSLSLFYHPTVKTGVFFTYDRTQAEYVKQNDGTALGWSSTTSQDNTENSYYLGVRFEPGGKLSGDVKLGWGERVWENAVDRDGHGYRDHGTWIADTSVRYDATAKTSISLYLTRGHYGSPDVVSASIVDTSAVVGLRQKIGIRFSLDLQVRYTSLDYKHETPGNPEKVLDAVDYTLGLDYEAKTWLKAGLKYQYKTKAANEVDYLVDEYEVSIISTQIAATF